MNAFEIRSTSSSRRSRPTKLSSSRWTASRGRSIFCLRSRAIRRSTSRRSPCLQLADQYLAFMESARSKRLELAADYLVMAAWLDLSSNRVSCFRRPRRGPGAGRRRDGGGSALAAAAASADARFRGASDGARSAGTATCSRAARPNRCASCEDAQIFRHAVRSLDGLFAAARSAVLGHRVLQMVRAPIYLIEEARERVLSACSARSEVDVARRAPAAGWGTGARRRTALASTFLAALELARDGRLEIRQMAPFGEIFLRDRSAGG